MVSSCCALGCGNRVDSRKEISFHRIPSNEDQRQLWLHAINRIDAGTRKPWVPSRYDVLCSEHFKEEDFYISKHRHLKMLKKSVVPSVFYWTRESKSKPVSPSEPVTSPEIKIEAVEADISACVEVVTLEHSYACEPDTLKRKYHETLLKLEEMQADLHNTKRREKRARVCIDKILQELAKQKKLSEDKLQMLEAYKDGLHEL